jgi:hypothetical protein
MKTKMNTKIKIMLGVGILVLGVFLVTMLVLIVRTKNNSDVTNKGQQNQAENSQIQQNEVNVPVIPVEIDYANNRTSPPTVPISAKDFLKDVPDPFDCGEVCKDETCQEIKQCLYAHAADCSSAKGRVIYPIRNSDKKKAITHIVVGLKGDKCLYKGVTTGAEAKADTPAAHTYICLVPIETLKPLFVDANSSQFVRENCSGTYADFLNSN